MFPSFNCDNSTFLKRPYNFPSDQNPNSYSFNFPSPFLDEHESPLSQIFLQSHQMSPNLPSPDQIHSNISDHQDHVDNSKSGADHQDQLPTRVTAPLRRRSLGVVPRRRTGKKDRHSKICTAQGIRDRRMRLSLQVARKFFDLQDMLGYDKASKTIEWLFTKSKKAIKDLMINDNPNNNISMSDAKSESFLSECEVVSGFNEHTSAKESKESVAPPTPTQKIASKSNVKESREKARERARSRTREKMMVKGLEHSEQWCKPNPNQNGDFQKLGFSNSPIEGVDQESKSKCVSPYEASCDSLEQYPLADISTIERFLGNLSSSSSSWGNYMLSMQTTPGCGISEGFSATVSDPNCSFMGFFGSWDSLNSGRTSSIYTITNQDSFASKPSSVYSATEELP